MLLVSLCQVMGIIQGPLLPNSTVFFPKKYGIIKGQSLVNNPLTRPYFLGGVGIGGLAYP